MEITIYTDGDVFEVEIDGLTHSRHFRREDAVQEIRDLSEAYAEDVRKARRAFEAAQADLEEAREEWGEVSKAVQAFLTSEGE